MSDVGEKYVAALAAKDTGTLLGLFAPTAEFRGVTPGRVWEVTTPRSIVDDVLYQWFDGDDVVESVDSVTSGVVVDRHRVDYTLRVRNPRGLHVVEQRAYYDLDADGRISRMSAMCAGFRPIEG